MWTIEHVRALARWDKVEAEERDIRVCWVWTLFYLGVRDLEVAVEQVAASRLSLGTELLNVSGWGHA